MIVSTIVIPPEKKVYLTMAIKELEQVEEGYLSWLLNQNDELNNKKMTKAERKFFLLYHGVPGIDEVSPVFDLGEPITVEK